MPLSIILTGRLTSLRPAKPPSLSSREFLPEAALVKYYSALLNSSTALCPPKPNPFEIA